MRNIRKGQTVKGSQAKERQISLGENPGQVLTYKKLVKHKRSPRKETKAFSNNTTRTVYRLGDGSEVRQSVLSGRKQRYVNGKPRGKEY